MNIENNFYLLCQFVYRRLGEFTRNFIGGGGGGGEEGEKRFIYF